MFFLASFLRISILTLHVPIVAPPASKVFQNHFRLPISPSQTLKNRTKTQIPQLLQSNSCSFSDLGSPNPSHRARRVPDAASRWSLPGRPGRTCPAASARVRGRSGHAAARGGRADGRTDVGWRGRRRREGETVKGVGWCWGEIGMFWGE